jgi:hypothetical protein
VTKDRLKATGEAAFGAFMAKEYPFTSYGRTLQFNTIWQAAYSAGRSAEYETAMECLRDLLQAYKCDAATRDDFYSELCSRAEKLLEDKS